MIMFILNDLNLFKNFQILFLVILCFLSISYRNKKSNKKKIYDL